MDAIKFAVAVLLFSLSATPVYAATINPNPQNISVAAGETFTLDINVDSEGAKVVTVKAQASYEANLLEVDSFSFATGWVPLSQPGYDSVGDSVLIKTAGYAGGFTGTQTFGTITFRAKTTGTAVVAVSNTSLVFNENNQDVLNGQGSAQVVIGGTAVAPAPAPVVEEEPEVVAEEEIVPVTFAETEDAPTVEEEAAEEVTQPSVLDEAADNAAQAAAVGAVDTNNSSIPTWVWIVVAAISVFGISFVVFRRLSR